MKTCRQRWHHLGLLLAVALGFVLAPGSGRAFEPVQRSISSSQQFIVYCSDARLRLAVTGYVETAKRDVLEALGVGDHWKFPIVIELRRPVSTDVGQPLRQVGLIETEGGWKVQIDVVLREDEFKQVRFPQLIIRGILLELAYRKHPPTVGLSYHQPPSWLVEGLARNMQVKATAMEPNGAVFRQLIETGHLPSIQDFLKSNVETMDPTSLTVHGSCAASLLDMLAGLPGGQAALVRMLEGLGESDGDPVALLLKHFPTLGGNEVALEKWWTLGLARYSTLDRHLALNVTETDARLTPLLNLTVVTDVKKGTKQEFTLANYKEFIKYPGAKAALFAQSNTLAGLIPQAHPLLRPVVAEYQRIATELANGKKRRMDEALSEAANFRVMIVQRMDKVADYLNWYEATQMSERSGAFDDYLKGAKAIEKMAPPKRNDSISKYIDMVQREFE